MQDKNRLQKLEKLFQEIAHLTVHHAVVADCAVVSAKDLGEALSRVDPEWWTRGYTKPGE